MVSHHHDCVFLQQKEVAALVTDLSVMTICNTPPGIMSEAQEN